jgi:hypothetical protein
VKWVGNHEPHASEKRALGPNAGGKDGDTPLERFSNCRTPEPMLLSGFFLKKKPPLMMPFSVHVLENRSNTTVVDSDNMKAL